MADQQFCLRWNNHQSTLISVFDTLLENGTLVDCTLAAEGQYLKAHKVVLSACSPYLETLLSQHYEKHPIVILKDVKFSELKSMMDYMYRGEVNISQDQLGTFLKAAESLQIKGLSDNGADGDARDVGSTPKAPPPRKATQPAPSNRPEPSRPDSPLTDGSMSPSSRKRRRVRRSSQDDGDSHLDNNSCDLPSQAQSTPVPNIPSASTSITTTPIVKPAIVKPEQTDVNRIDSNSLPPEALKKEIETISEPLLEPKTEYLEDVNNEDSVEDLTLDDDDDMEGMDISNMSNMSNMSRPGPSHGNDISNQGFAPWQLGANQSGTDEVFMAAQEAVNQHRDSQDCEIINSKNIGKKRQNAPLSKKEDRRSTSQRKDKFEDRQHHYKDGFTKQIFQFASELSSIVSITKKSFSNPTSTDGDVVHVDSDSDVEFLPDCESRDSCPAAESAPGNLVFQSVEDNAIATMNPTNVEPDIDPLSLPHEVFIKTEPLPVVIKSENIHSFLADQEANQASLQQKKVVPLFQCDYCPYTSKHRNVIGNHKWREHKDEWLKKSGGKSNLPKAAKKHDRLFKCNYCSFTSPHKNVLGSHKFRAHSVRGRSKQWFDKVLNVRSLRPATKSVELEQRVEGIKNEEKYEVKEEQTSQLSPLSFGSPAAKKCSHCSFLTKSSSALVMHKKLKHFIQPPKDVSAGEKIVIPLIKKCPLCPFKSRFPAAMGSHKSKKHFIPSGRNGDESKQIVVPLTKKCSLCPFKSRFPGAMASHKSRKHFIQPGKNDDEDEKIVVPSMKKCSHCSFETRHNYALAAHKKHVHSIMPERQGNKVNKIRVSVIKKCNLCPFKTKFNAALAMHKKTKHFIQPPKKLNREGRFECEHCHSSYSNLGNLQRHLKSHHGDGGVARKKCPHCGVMKVTQFQLRRHIENKHPEHWGEMINQKPVSSVEGEHLTETKEAVKHLVQRKTPNSNEPCRSKLSCQSCHFQTEDSHILGLHKQKQHFQKKSDGQGGLMKCLFCSEVCQIKSLLMKHVKSKHPGAWLKMERSAAQSKLRYESGGEETVTKKISKLTNESNKEASSTADRFNETNNSNSSWKDINTEEDGKTQGAKKTFCEICDRFYNATYYRYHTCKNKIECDLCSYKTFSIYNMSVHKTKTHRSQVLLKSEKSGEIKSQENKINVAKEISQSQDYSEEDTKFETASTEQSSVSELNDDEEYVPSKTSKKVTKFVGARKKCNKCKKSFHLGYIKLHRCAKGLKCSSCSYTDTSLAKLKLHERFHHSNLETETDESATNEEPMSVDNQLSDIEPKTEMKLENDLESTCGTEGQHLLPTTETEDTVLENKWQCDMCSFESSTEAFMVRHKLKQHPVKKSAAGNVQNRRKLKCEFCTLVFNNTNQLKNHLNRKHKEEQEKTHTQDLKRVKLSKQSDSAMEAVTSEEDRPSSGDTVEEIELPSSDNGNTQPPYESVIEGTQPLSDNAVQEQPSEPTETLANANVEESSPPSDIVEGSSNVNVEESSPPSDIVEGSSNVQEDRVKCENCKMYFKTSTLGGHYCRPVLRCQECTFITRIKLQMRLHKRDHLKDDCVLTEESLYQCRICQKKFASKSWFRHHKINECQKKSFHQCSICQKKFHQEKHLELHVLQIHRDKNDEGKEGKDEEKDQGKDEEKDDDKSKYPCIPV